MTFLHLLRAEFRAIVRYRSLAMILLVAPFLYAIVYPQPYLPQLARKIPVAIVDLDQSVLSRQLIRMSQATEQLQVIEYPESPEAAAILVRQQAINGFLTIPADFERKIRRGDSVDVAVFADGTRFLVYSQIATGFSQAALTLGAGTEIKRLQAKGYSERQARAIRDATPLQIQSLWNPSNGYGIYVVPAVLLLVLQQTLLLGLCVRGAVSPFPPVPTLVARWVAMGSIHTLHLLIYLFGIWPLFGLSGHGHVGVVLLALVPFFIATLSMGTWISHRFRQETTAMQILLPLSLPILMLSGFSWPTEKMPLWLQWLAWPLPSSHAILAFLRIQQAGASLSEILSYWRSLWLVAAFWSFLLGWEYWRTRKRR